MKHSKTETIIGSIVLCLLGSIAIGVYHTQFSFNPAVLAIKDQSKETDLSFQYSTQPISPIFPIPPDVIPLSPPEQFNSENLYNKINGKAELYLSAGFVELKCQRFSLVNQPDMWIEAYIYQMEDPSKAFSVYSAQRREDGQPIQITPYSYRTPNAVFLTHGNFYVEIVSSIISESVGQIAQQIATQWVNHTKIDSTSTQITEIDLFPKDNLIKDSIMLLSENVFGYDRFKNIFIGTYQFGINQVTAFISKQETTQDAQELANGYHQFLKMFGGKEIETQQIPTACKMMLILDRYETICSHKQLIVGVREAPSVEVATHLTQLLLKERSDGF